MVVVWTGSNAPSGGSAGGGGCVSVDGLADEDDLDQLYRALSKRLERIVRAVVRAPDPVIEDACQFAWSRLVYHRERVRREAALAWLATTAVHEAYKLIRRGDRECSLDGALACDD